MGECCVLCGMWVLCWGDTREGRAGVGSAKGQGVVWGDGMGSREVGRPGRTGMVPLSPDGEKRPGSGKK